MCPNGGLSSEEVDSSGLASCSHQTCLGPRPAAAGRAMISYCAARRTQSFVKCKAMMMTYEACLGGIMACHALLFC